MKRVKIKHRGFAGLVLAAALVLTEAALALFPVTAYAQDELLEDSEMIQEEAAPGAALIEEEPVVDELITDTGSPEENLSVPEETGTDIEDIGNDSYVYVEQTAYSFTFIILNNGMINKVTYPNTLNSPAGLADAIGTSNINSVKALAGENRINGWWLGMNGHNESWLTEDFRESGAQYKFLPKMDYTLTAVLSRKLSDNIYVDITPVVYYDGRAHISTAEYDNEKSINDLEIGVYYVPTGKSKDEYAEPLRQGVDYKLSYKNNVNASMKMNDDGTYEKLALTDSKRPYVQVTGLNTYAGFSAEVYFDILPYNFGEWEYAHGYKYNAQLSGLESSYTLKNGKLTKAIAPKVTLRNWYDDNVITLKKGTDYDIRLYRYDESSRWIYKESVNEAGRWLCTVRGKGNYCGTVFGQAELEKNTIFNDGTQAGALNPAVCNYTGASVPAGQFRVEDSSHDLSDAKVKIAKKSVPYTHGKYYSSSDLGIRVTIAGSPLTEGVDYRVIYDGDDYKYISGVYNKVYLTDKSDAVFNDKIWMANTYKIRIEAVPGNPNGYYGIYEKGDKVTVKGVGLKEGGFKLSGASKTFDDTYDTVGKYSYKYGTKLYDLSGYAIENYFSGHITTITSSYKTFDYLAALEDKFNSPYSDNNSANYAYASFTERAKFAGTYTREICAVGPGVNRGDNQYIKFKIVPLDMKKAVKSGMIKVSAAAGTYNAGGSIPASITVNFNGYNNVITMYKNSTEEWISDSEGDSTKVKLTLTNNTKPGAGYITISAADNSYYQAFKGSAKKAAEFRIDPLKVTAGTIRVLKPGDYKVEYGKNSGKVEVTGSEPVGTLYAKTRAAAADKTGKFPAKAGIDLYQSYYATEDEYLNDTASLKKLASSQYSLTPTLLMGGSYNIDVTNGKDGAAKTGLDFVTSTSLGETYDVYDEAVTITSITVRYNGVDYVLPADSGKLVTGYKGEQVRFDNVFDVKVKSKSAGEVTLSTGDYAVTYGDNVAAGKSAGSITVTLKKGAMGFKYGGSKEFRFNIESAGNIKL